MSSRKTSFVPHLGGQASLHNLKIVNYNCVQNIQPILIVLRRNINDRKI